VLRERETLNTGGGAKRTLRQIASGYLGIFAMPRAAGTYSLIFLNAVFPSGVPGMFLGPAVGKLALGFAAVRVFNAERRKPLAAPG
jgi:hypothetical protein